MPEANINALSSVDASDRAVAVLPDGSHFSKRSQTTDRRVSDIVDSQTRSRMMASVRGKNTAPELALRSALHRRGFRFRIHNAGMPGRPDIVMARYNAVIFVHGCFWHRHANCRLTYTPKTRVEFWTSKFNATIIRDEDQVKKLLVAGWRVAIVWECAMRAGGADAVALQLANWLPSAAVCTEIEAPLG